jgi:sulfate adenylyltransferase subunit 2
MSAYTHSIFSALPPSPAGAAASSDRLSHLKLLEAESIHIFREAAAEFQKPVMLYSIGKDSSVMLRLAQKAFFPGPIPFPLLHVDTGYKFREMITFRDSLAQELGLDLRVWRNERALAVARGSAPPWLRCGVRWRTT